MNPTRKTGLMAAAAAIAVVAAMGMEMRSGGDQASPDIVWAGPVAAQAGDEPEEFRESGERQGRPCAAPAEKVPEDAAPFEKFKATTMKRIQNKAMKTFAGDEWCKGDYGEKFQEKWKPEEKIDDAMSAGGQAAERAVENAPDAEEVNRNWEQGVQKFERMMKEQEAKKAAE